MKSNLMTSKLAEDPIGRPSEESSERNRKGPKKARAAVEDDAIDIFNDGLAKMGAQKVAAVDLGVSVTHLSDFTAGRATIAFHRVLTAGDKNREAAVAIVAALCKRWELAPPSKKRVVSKRDAEKQLVMELRRLAPVYELVRRSAAEKLGTDEDVFDDVMDEPTNPGFSLPRP